MILNQGPRWRQEANIWFLYSLHIPNLLTNIAWLGEFDYPPPIHVRFLPEKIQSYPT